jgi:hypothetical protein
MMVDARSIGSGFKDSDARRPLQALHAVTESTTNTAREWNMKPNFEIKH